MKKKAVILTNLGGPENIEEVRDFLYNLFSDPDIFPLPSLLQKPLAYAIARFRYKKSQEYYRKIGGGSPILKETKEQAAALQKELGEDFYVTVAMRYSKPSIFDAIKEVINKEISNIIFFPLYPQFSFSTTLSAINELKRVVKNLNISLNINVVRNFHNHPLFISSWVEIIKKYLKSKGDYILFSAHSIPLSMVEKGDTYKEEVEETVKLIVSELGHENYALAYQSKVGPMRWLRPFTEDVLVTLGERGTKRVLLVPISFVCEHSETLYELDIQNREIARKAGIEEYVRVETLRTNPIFIKALAHIVKSEKIIPLHLL